MNGAEIFATQCSDYGSHSQAGTRAVPIEAPIAIETNGVTYAVMMATPIDLEDFVTGFLLSEGLATFDEIDAIGIHRVDGGEGMVVRVTLPAHRVEPIFTHARRRLGDSSCGICGVESIERALKPLDPLAPRPLAAAAAIHRALANLGDAQVLGRQTAATHAAAFAASDGTVRVVREDVGRHNALDKVIGALARAGIDPGDGFLIVTSRASYELVEKAVRARCPLLVAISAPTDLAVRRAQTAGLALGVVARADSMLWVAGPMMEDDGGR